MALVHSLEGAARTVRWPGDELHGPGATLVRDAGAGGASVRRLSDAEVWSVQGGPSGWEEFEGRFGRDLLLRGAAQALPPYTAGALVAWGARLRSATRAEDNVGLCWDADDAAAAADLAAWLKAWREDPLLPSRARGQGAGPRGGATSAPSSPCGGTAQGPGGLRGSPGPPDGPAPLVGARPPRADLSGGPGPAPSGPRGGSERAGKRDPPA